MPPSISAGWAKPADCGSEACDAPPNAIVLNPAGRYQWGTPPSKKRTRGSSPGSVFACAPLIPCAASAPAQGSRWRPTRSGSEHDRNAEPATFSQRDRRRRCGHLRRCVCACALCPAQAARDHGFDSAREILQGSARAVAHDPEKLALGLRPDGWKPVFRKDHAQTKGWSGMTIRT